MASAGVRIQDTRVRIGASFNPYTLVKLGLNATLNAISDSFWQSYDATGQMRYSVDAAAYGNRISDSFDAVQVGASNGVTSLFLANGANQNVTLAADGVVYIISGPTGAFSIGGFTNGFDGRKLELHNSSGQTLTVNNEDGSSTNVNRIRCNSGVNGSVNNLGTTSFRYIASISRWGLTGIG